MKILMIHFLRLKYLISRFPFRIWRILLHLKKGLISLFSARSPIFTFRQVVMWWSGVLFYSIDSAGLGEFYEFLCGLIKWNTRPLTTDELRAGKSVFGDSISWKRVRVDEKAFIGCKQWHFCYVSFYTINSWGTMNLPLLIHELTHVWQYEKKGAVYIPLAIQAMHSASGYDYGGIQGLKNALNNGKTLFDFNLEQQADLIADYFRVRENLPAKWSKGRGERLELYEYFISNIQNKSVQHDLCTT